MVFVYLSCLITTVLFFLSKPPGFSFFADSWLSSSQLLALVGTVLFCLNYVLSSRAKFLENIFGGLDKVYKTHHLLGATSFVLIINHPIFLAIKALPNSTAARNYLFIGTSPSYNFGVMALYSLILVLLFTFIIKLPYHRWLSIHKLMGVPLFLAILHVVLITSDVSRYPLLRLWIITFLVAATIGFIYKFIIYDRLGPIYQYKIDKTVRHEGISDIYLSPISTRLPFTAGQYVFVTFHQNYIPSESHPFTISSSPNSELLRLSIKSLGDYTTTIAGLNAGSAVSLIGPYGKFGDKFFQNKSVVCIAGGIGVTPFLSLIATESKKPLSRPISFYYSVKTRSEAIFDQEIIEYQTDLPSLDYRLHCTDQDGRLTADKIKSDVEMFSQSLFFICGPTAMMEAISVQLQQLGVKEKNIIYEDFSFGPVN